MQLIEIAIYGIALSQLNFINFIYFILFNLFINSVFFNKTLPNVPQIVTACQKRSRIINTCVNKYKKLNDVLQITIILFKLLFIYIFRYLFNYNSYGIRIVTNNFVNKLKIYHEINDDENMNNIFLTDITNKNLTDESTEESSDESKQYDITEYDNDSTDGEQENVDEDGEQEDSEQENEDVEDGEQEDSEQENEDVEDGEQEDSEQEDVEDGEQENEDVEDGEQEEPGEEDGEEDAEDAEEEPDEDAEENITDYPIISNNDNTPITPIMIETADTKPQPIIGEPGETQRVSSARLSEKSKDFLDNEPSSFESKDSKSRMLLNNLPKGEIVNEPHTMYNYIFSFFKYV